MIKVNCGRRFFRRNAALARIAAVTPQRGWKAGERKGLAAERIGEPRREEYERKAGNSFRKKNFQPSC